MYLIKEMRAEKKAETSHAGRPRMCKMRLAAGAKSTGKLLPAL